MAKTNYIERVNGFIVPYLAKNGYELIKTEFVNEDNNYYLRLYIDLTEEEQAKREAKAAGEADESSDKLTAAAGDDVTCGSKETVEAATGKDASNQAKAVADADTASTAPDGALAETGTDEELSEEPLTPGVSINDCVKVSRYLSKWLDKEDFIKEMYTMEVCSRGFLNDAAASDDKEKEQ